MRVNIRTIFLLIILFLIHGVATLAGDQNHLKYNTVKSISESDELPISNIQNIVFSKSGKYIALCGNSNADVFLYDSSYTLLKTFTFQGDYIDTAAVLATSDDITTGYMTGLRRELLTANGDTMPMDYQRQYLRNKFSNAAFIGDSILLLNATLHFLEFDSLKKQISFIGAIATYNLTTNKLNFTRCENYTNPGNDTLKQRFFMKSEMSTFIYIPYTQRLLISVIGNGMLNFSNPKERLNSATLGIFNLQGLKEKYLSPIPDEFWHQQLWMHTLSSHAVLNKRNEIVYSYEFLTRIYNSSTSTSFDLQNLSTNSRYLDSIKSFDFQNTNKKNNFSPWSKLAEFQKYATTYIKRLDITKNNTYIVHIVYTPPDSTKPQWKIQEYTTAGKLLRETSVNQLADNGKIQYVA